MNLADADDISARLAAYGGTSVDSPQQADLVLVNTCTVRKKAEDKALSYFGLLKQNAASNGRNPYVVAMGCVMPKGGRQLKNMHRNIDLVINYSDPDIVLAELTANYPPLANASEADSFLPLAGNQSSQLTFVTAIRGCNHRCSFCIVPWARGPQRDVPIERIVAEAQAHEQAGAPDICILGQSIMAYGKTSGDSSPRFIEMMKAVLDSTNFPWVTFLTSLAVDLTAQICDEVIAHPRITPLLHLPIQSGSDKVLADMRRGHTTDQYRKLVAKAREVRPGLYLTTDLLVGFPTETDADFQQTLDFVQEIGFDDAFMFAYSERPGTHSARKHPDVLSRPEKIERLTKLIEMQRNIGRERNQRYVGQTLDVLIETAANGSATGRTAFNKPVKLPMCACTPGKIVKAKILFAKGTTFTGELSGGHGGQ